MCEGPARVTRKPAVHLSNDDALQFPATAEIPKPPGDARLMAATGRESSDGGRGLPAA